jgi:pyruvate ferredoxin oxidoreductase delta subunit
MKRNVLEEIPESPRATKLRSLTRTGLWRSMKPVLNGSKCVRCGICWMYCPDRAVEKVEDGTYEINYYVCKGCGICSEECTSGAIEMVEEDP